MAAKLPKIGVQAIVDGAGQYFKDITKVGTSTDDAAKSIQKSTKGLDGITKILDKFGGKFGGQISGAIEKVQSFQAELPALASALGGVSVGMVALGAAAVAAAVAFVALGTRGANLLGLATAFDNISASVGQLSTDLLGRLRTASAGTISDFALMQRANQALSGATGQLGIEMGRKLPELLAIARTQAKLTGQSIDFLFESLILGIRKGSPLRIDNANLIISEGQAYADYAAQIGISVDAMTEEQKSLAVLNATLAAGNIALAQAGNIQETAADKMARMNAIFTNIADVLAVGVQPAFGMVLDVINQFSAQIQSVVVAINPLLSSLLEMGVAVLAGPVSAILTALDPIIKFGNFLITLATAILQPVIRAFTAFFKSIGEGAQIISQLVGNLFASLGLNWDNLSINFGRGAGMIIASFGNGLLAAYNAVVAPVVLFIATAIADFLVGQSPPPKGPLSQIDKGGAAVMMAWAEGFAGVSLQPIEEVAAAVEATLGNIGAFAMPQVEARIGLLDQALAPFNNQLEIVKANFEAINAPAQAALEAIDRQLAKAQEALTAGEAGSAEKVRALDEQREMIEKAVAAQQELVDQSQIQQALAKAQQAPERALLAIQQARLKALETKPTKEAKAAAEAAGKGGAPTPEAIASGGGSAGGFDSSLPGVADLISGQAAVDQIGQGFGEGLAVSINQETLGAFQANQALIGQQVDRIRTADVGARLANAFSGLGTSIQVKLQEASVVINDWIGGITDPAREGSIPYAFNALANGDYSALVAGLMIPFDNLSQGIVDFLYNNFDPENINSILGTLTLLPTRITNTLSTLGTAFNDAVFVPIETTITDVGTSIAHFFVDTGEGTLSGMLDAGVAWFTALPQRIFDALASIGRVFYAVMVTPLVAGVNLAIEAIEGLINNTLSALGTAIGSLQTVADAVGLGDEIAEITSGLANGITLPRISLPTPPTAQMPAAAKGGLFGVRVHPGEQVMGMGAGQKMAVFPRDVTRNLDLIASVLGQSMPLSLNGALAGMSGDSNSTVNNTNNFSLPQPASSGNSVQMVATQMAMKRRVF